MLIIILLAFFGIMFLLAVVNKELKDLLFVVGFAFLFLACLTAVGWMLVFVTLILPEFLLGLI